MIRERKELKIMLGEMSTPAFEHRVFITTDEFEKGYSIHTSYVDLLDYIYEYLHDRLPEDVDSDNFMLALSNLIVKYSDKYGD